MMYPVPNKGAMPCSSTRDLSRSSTQMSMRQIIYSEDLYTGHTNNGNIQITDFCYSIIQAMTWNLNNGL